MLSGSLLMDERREDESKKVSKTASFPDFGLYVPLSSFFAVFELLILNLYLILS